MTAIAYELASNDGKPFGLRPDLMVFGGREAFWDELDHLAASGTVSGFLFHRLFGEPQAGDIFDWDARYQIEHSGDPALTDYAKHMARRLMRIAITYPDLAIDLYLGCMDHWRMQRMLNDGDGAIDLSLQYVTGESQFAEVGLALDGAPSVTRGERSPLVDGDGALVGVSGELELGSGWSLFGEARATLGSEQEEVAGTLTLGWAF